MADLATLGPRWRAGGRFHAGWGTCIILGRTTDKTAGIDLAWSALPLPSQPRIAEAIFSRGLHNSSIIQEVRHALQLRNPSLLEKLRRTDNVRAQDIGVERIQEQVPEVEVIRVHLIAQFGKGGYMRFSSFCLGRRAGTSVGLSLVRARRGAGPAHWGRPVPLPDPAQFATVLAQTSVESPEGEVIEPERSEGD